MCSCIYERETDWNVFLNVIQAPSKFRLICLSCSDMCIYVTFYLPIYLSTCLFFNSFSYLPTYHIHIYLILIPIYLNIYQFIYVSRDLCHHISFRIASDLPVY